MKLVKFNNDKSMFELSSLEVYIIRSIIGEVYAGVCVDAEEFEIIHAIEKEEVLKLKHDIYAIYKQLNILGGSYLDN